MQGYVEPNQPLIFSNKPQAVWFIIVAMMIAVFTPTSVGGNINPLLIVLGNVAALAVFLFAAFYYRLNVSYLILIPALLLISLLIIMTFLSPFNQVTPGAFLPYLTFVLICSVKIDQLILSKSQQKFLFFLATFVVLLCFMAFFRVAFVVDIQESYYQMFPDLYKFMMMWANKPVLMFSTHSVAGFAYFLIAVCFFAAYINKKELKNRWILLWVSIAYSVTLALLLSNTGLALLALMLIIYLFYFFRHGNPKIALLGLMIIMMLVVYFIDPITNVVQSVASTLFDVLSRKENGLMARFSVDSRLGGSIMYLVSSPFIGVGITNGGDIAFGDSFYSEYMLRLSVFGFFLVAFVTYGYLYVNTQSARYFTLLATLVFIADLGYPLFVTYRFVFLFPIAIIFFNTLALNDKFNSRKNHR